LISKKFGFVNVQTAHMLKDSVAKKTEIGKTSMEKINSGDLVPDDIMSVLVNQRLSSPDC